MKNLLLFLLVLLFGSVQAQSFQKIINKEFSSISKQLKNIEARSGEYKICEESTGLNDSGELITTGNGKYTIKTNGNNVFISVYIEEYDEEGDTSVTLSKIYSSHRFAKDLGENIEENDSLFIFAKDSTGTFLPYVASYSDFDGDKIIQTKTFIDFGILFGDDPIGLYLGSIVDFHYDGDALDYKTKQQISFNTGLLEKYDSTVFKYENSQKVEETNYIYESDSLIYIPSEKKLFSYDDNGNNIKEEVLNYLGNSWIYDNRTNYEFDLKNREVFSLQEKTYNNGETWVGDSRDSIIYDSFNPMYLGFPNRVISETLTGGDNWQLSGTDVYTDCGSIPDNTKEVNKLNFDARFANESIIIDSNDFGSGNVKIQLVDIQGRIIFQKDFEEVPTIIHSSGLNEGVYVLTINTKDGFGTKKLIKK